MVLYRAGECRLPRRDGRANVTDDRYYLPRRPYTMRAATYIAAFGKRLDGNAVIAL